jgi:hypothetical protein
LVILTSRLTARVSLSLALAVVLCCCQAAQASAYVGGTGALTFVGTPTVVTLGPLRAAEVTLDNHLGVSVLGIAIMVIHNALGQTIYYSTATLNLTRGSFATAYIVEAGIPTGVYNATIFAFSAGGVAVSNSTTIAFSAR